MRYITPCLFVLTLLACGNFAHADDQPTTAPAGADSSAVIHPGDKDALAAAADKDVVIEGVIDAASWSSSGKVMQAIFKDSAGSKLQATIFSSNKDKFDQAFGGDVTKALPGAKVRIHGHLKDYKGTPEVVLDNVAQITILEPAATQPAPTRDER